MAKRSMFVGMDVQRELTTVRPGEVCPVDKRDVSPANTTKRQNPENKEYEGGKWPHLFLLRLQANPGHEPRRGTFTDGADGSSAMLACPQFSVRDSSEGSTTH
jgi:hypothetical protein